MKSRLGKLVVPLPLHAIAQYVDRTGSAVLDIRAEARHDGARPLAAHARSVRPPAPRAVPGRRHVPRHSRPRAGRASAYGSLVMDRSVRPPQRPRPLSACRPRSCSWNWTEPMNGELLPRRPPAPASAFISSTRTFPAWSTTRAISTFWSTAARTTCGCWASTTASWSGRVSPSRCTAWRSTSSAPPASTTCSASRPIAGVLRRPFSCTPCLRPAHHPRRRPHPAREGDGRDGRPVRPPEAIPEGRGGAVGRLNARSRFARRPPFFTLRQPYRRVVVPVGRRM